MTVSGSSRTGSNVVSLTHAGSAYSDIKKNALVAAGIFKLRGAIQNLRLI